jgi:hypothetical protein
MARSDFQETAGEEEYDPLDIRTRSQDEHGHSFSPRAHMPKTLGAVIGSFQNNPEFPEYSGAAAAFIRDAVYHRAKFWQLHGSRAVTEAGARLLRIYEVETRALEYREMIKQVDKMVDDLDETVREAVAVGDFGFAERTLDDYETLAHEEFEAPHTEKILDRVTLLRTKIKHRF